MINPIQGNSCDLLSHEKKILFKKVDDDLVRVLVRGVVVVVEVKCHKVAIVLANSFSCDVALAVTSGKRLLHIRSSLVGRDI